METPPRPHSFFQSRFSFGLGPVFIAIGVISLLPAPSPVAAVDIPSSAAGPAGSGVDPGFVVRSVQAPAIDPLGLTYSRALSQLNGTLLDAMGDPVPDEATPGPNPDGSHSVAGIVNFELSAMKTGNFLGDVLFPGIPGTGFHTENFTTEVVAYLELTAGTHELGAQVWVERTDAPGGGDDDALFVFAGADPRDVFATSVHIQARSAEAPPFTPAADDNAFMVTVPQDGVYPFRLIYANKSGGGTLEWYSVQGATRIPINDPTNPNAIRAFQRSSAAIHNRSYVAQLSPFPNSAGIPPEEAVEILLMDGGGTVDPDSITLFLNDSDVTGALAVARDEKAGRTTVTYQPDPGRTEQSNGMTLEFDDGAGRQRREWTFESAPAEPQPPSVTGHWDFSGDLTATVGIDLEYFGAAAENGTEFGTTMELGIPAINGEIAEVMSVPQGNDRNIGYRMFHRIPANGGGTKVNRYTLIMDLYLPDGTMGAGGLIQIDSATNSNDSDLFWQNGNVGQGAGGYEGLDTFTAGAWHRLAFSVDLAASPPVILKFVDGVDQQPGGWIQQSRDQARRALRPAPDYSVLFTDGDQDEQHPWYVNAVQILDGPMTAQELAELGGPTAEGPPVVGGPLFQIRTIRRDPALGDVTLEWNSRPGRFYSIDTSHDLSTWLELTDGFPSQGDFTQFTEPGAGAGAGAATRRFYRVRRE